MNVKLTAVIVPLAVVVMTSLSIEAHAGNGDPGGNGEGNGGQDNGLHAGHEPHMLYVRFIDGVPPAEGMAVLSVPGMPEHVPDMLGAQWGLATGDLDVQALAVMHATAEENLQATIPKPWQGVYVTLPAGADTWAAIEGARGVGFVEKAIPVPLPADPQWDGQPDYQGDQGYLDNAAANGIGAENVWNLYGITGQGVQVAVIDKSANLDHCDLPAVTQLWWGATSDPFERQHGTKVLGELVALDDGQGTTGICHGADRAFYQPVEVPFGTISLKSDFAVLSAAANLNAGDVIVIVVGIRGPRFGQGDTSQFGILPLEWFEPCYDAIRIAVGNGRIVVESAGNGSQDLDDDLYSTGNDGHWPFMPARDSGAILVGSGNSETNFQGEVRSARHNTNYGETVDLQGWGDSVMTTGGPGIWNEVDCEYVFFGDTSAAGPIVAGACVLVQSWCKANLSTTLSPQGMMWRLQLSGQAQGGDDPEGRHIGPLPNVLACIEALGGGETERTVPGEYDTIQEAVDASMPGDTIVVGPGTWAGFQSDGKSLLVESTDGPVATFIDGGGSTECIVCTDGDLTIDGFTIRNCWADSGAAIYFEGGDLVTKSCHFLDNHAEHDGGAVRADAELTAFIDCTFRDNEAELWGGAAMIHGADARIENCFFEGNLAKWSGAIRTTADTVTVADTTFYRNDSLAGAGALDLSCTAFTPAEATITDTQFMLNTGRRGGGIVVTNNDVLMQRCQFLNNETDEFGGAIWIGAGLSVIEQCRFSGNAVGEGWTGGAISSQIWSAPDVFWSVFCDNDPDHIDGPFNDLGANCFADSCEDANEDNIPDSCQAAADVNGDGEVDVADLLAILAAFGDCEGCPEDINGDGQVDIEDLLLLLACWGGGC